MKTSDFDYPLPQELIAQEPLQKRDASRLLHLCRESGSVVHRTFNDLPGLLQRGDRLVFNNTKVLPARIFCYKETGARVELLFTRRIEHRTWEALVKPSRRLKEGAIVSLEKNSSVTLQLDRVGDNGDRVFSLHAGPFNSIEAVLQKYGEMPLPPYIRRRAREDDRDTYQTVYARHNGAVAAPTAGLHFTETLMRECTQKGVDFSFVTLHVGIGTFRPVKEENPENHVMHSEEYMLSRDTAEEINRTGKQGGRIIAVGTTSVRVLEHCADSDGYLQPGTGTTDLMILPGHSFNIIDGLLTNFHLPRSTLLMLVSAFAGREQVIAAYKEAVNKKYRFYSYGDAMIIL